MNFPILNADQLRRALVNSGQRTRAQRLRRGTMYSALPEGYGVYYLLTYQDDVQEWAVVYVDPETMEVRALPEEDAKELGPSVCEAFKHNTGASHVRNHL